MTLTNLFEYLGAPLVNQRWSWGGVRDDGSVVLRVWQDRKTSIDGDTYMMLTHHQKYVDRQDSLGYRERLKHVDMVRGGAKYYMVMCQAKDVVTTPREIQSFNDRDIFVGGDVQELGGDVWIQVRARIPRSEIGDSVES